MKLNVKRILAIIAIILAVVATLILLAFSEEASAQNARERILERQRHNTPIVQSMIALVECKWTILEVQEILGS